MIHDQTTKNRSWSSSFNEDIHNDGLCELCFVKLKFNSGQFDTFPLRIGVVTIVKLSNNILIAQRFQVLTFGCYESCFANVPSITIQTEFKSPVTSVSCCSFEHSFSIMARWTLNHWNWRKVRIRNVRIVTRGSVPVQRIQD